MLLVMVCGFLAIAVVVGVTPFVRAAVLRRSRREWAAYDAAHDDPRDRP